MRHKNYILTLFFSLVAFAASAQVCPGPAQRQALINLQKSGILNGTRAYQIPMTDTCGNQRYVTIDSIITIVVDSIGSDTALQRNWYTYDGTTVNPLRTATIDSAAQWIGDNADGFLYFQMGTLAGGRAYIDTDESSVYFGDLGGVNTVEANTTGIDITTSATASRAVDLTTDTVNMIASFDPTLMTVNLLSDGTYFAADSLKVVGIGQFPGFPSLNFDGTEKGILYDPDNQGINIVAGDGSTGGYLYQFYDDKNADLYGTIDAAATNTFTNQFEIGANFAFNERKISADLSPYTSVDFLSYTGDPATRPNFIGYNLMEKDTNVRATLYFGESGVANDYYVGRRAFGIQTDEQFKWFDIVLPNDTTSNTIAFYDSSYLFANAVPSSTVGDTSFHFWAGIGTTTTPGFMTLNDIRGTGDNWYNSDGTTTDYNRIADVSGVATWRSDDVLLDGVYPFRFELGPGPQNEPEMMTWVFPQDSLTLGMSDQEIILNSPGTHFVVSSDDYMIVYGDDSLQIGNIGTTLSSGDILAIYGTDSPNQQTVRRLEGTFNADAISWAAGAAGDRWDAVPANRTSFAETTVNLIPAESQAEILVTPTGGGTVELNYTPAMPAAGYTTWRYIYNAAASETTVSTDQAWQFQDETGDLGASFSLAAGINAKLVWIYDAVAADARFFVIRFASGTGDGDILQGGNSFGTAMTIGTNDNNAVNVEVNGTTGFSMGTDYALTATASTASTNSADNRVIIQTNSTGTPAANFGGKILFQGESSTTDNQDVADIQATWFESTHATRKGDLRLRTSVNGTMTEMARFYGNNAASMYLGGGSTRYFDAGITAATTYTVGGSGSTVILGGSTGTATVGNSSGPVNLYRNPGATSTPVDFGVIANSTGAVANGFGPRFIFQGESSTAAAQDMGSIALIWTTVTHASRSAAILFSTVNSAGANTERMRIAADGKVGIGLTPTTDILEVAGNVSLTAAGNKLKIATGANASVGTATLSSGTVTVNTTAVTASSLIFLTYNTPSGTTGDISAPSGSIVAGTSFVINSTSGADDSTVNWWIIN